MGLQSWNPVRLAVALLPPWTVVAPPVSSKLASLPPVFRVSAKVTAAHPPPEKTGCVFSLPVVIQKHSLGACTVANPSAGISRVSGVTARNVIRIACVSGALRSVVILGLTFHTLPVQHLLPLFRVLFELDIAREVVRMWLYSW